MKTIKNNIENELIIKNSKFITYLIKIDKNTDIENEINKIKLLHPKATHHCYSFIIENRKKSSDDGEPGGTAGMPMLNVLEKEEILNVLAITVRYFGGIKLGAGGLVRAYSKSVKDALIKSELIDIIKGYKINLLFSYDKQKEIDYLLKNYKITNKQYLEDINYEILLPINNIDIIKDYNYKIIEELYIKKVED